MYETGWINVLRKNSIFKVAKICFIIIIRQVNNWYVHTLSIYWRIRWYPTVGTGRNSVWQIPMTCLSNPTKFNRSRQHQLQIRDRSLVVDSFITCLLEYDLLFANFRFNAKVWLYVVSASPIDRTMQSLRSYDKTSRYFQ